MGLSYMPTAVEAVQSKLEFLVEWSVTGRQFLARLNTQGINLVLDAQPISDDGTHFGVAGASRVVTDRSSSSSSDAAAPIPPPPSVETPVIRVNMRTLALKTISEQSATVLHELFHAVHHKLDPVSYDRRKRLDGEADRGLGGWVALGGNAEEQLAITGHCIELTSTSAGLQRWLSDEGQDVGFVGPDGTFGERVSLGPFCENRVLRHLGLPLRDSHGKPGESHATPDVASARISIDTGQAVDLGKRADMLARMEARAAERKAASKAKPKPNPKR